VTFDDGYRDTQQFAYPILKKFEVPFAVYVATSFADRVGEMWWLALEAVIARNTLVGLHMDGEDRWFDCASVEQKYEAFTYIYWWLRKRETDEEVRQIVRDLAARNKVPIANFCDELCMTWPEIAELASDPLVTIGAHTVNHPILAKVSEQSVRNELENSRAIIGAALGKLPEHLAYPVGDPTSAAQREFQIAADLGFKTAVTTRPGVLFEEHRDHLLALPRVSLNGEFQRARYASVLVSGAATGLWNGFRKLNVA
jgi:peptidoglycan/xylan/chitin deacetylase (PgdA/CDA1 family)